MPPQHLIMTTPKCRFAGSAVADRNACERLITVFMSIVAPMSLPSEASILDFGVENPCRWWLQEI
jgi:hypothetical protein